MPDVVVRGGTVIDGTGREAYEADVAITDGRISDIGRRLVGDRYLNAGGHFVTPGFIDIHTHYDAQVFWDPALSPSCFHGVTTVIAGNCGFSIAPARREHRSLIFRTLENVEDMDVATLEAGVPRNFSTFPEYLTAVRRTGLGLNFGTYIGHTALRLFVMGDEAYSRAATGDEVLHMQDVVREAMQAGAVGFATSLSPTHRGADGRPVPSRLAERAEIDALLSTLGECGVGVAAFTPGEQVSPADLYNMQPSVGRPFTYTALMTMPNGLHRTMAKLNRRGWAAGAQVWPQVTPRPLQFSMSLADPFTFNMNPHFAALLPLGLPERRVAYGDLSWRTKASEAWQEGMDFGRPRWETFRFTESTSQPELEGHRVVNVASERGVSPLDAVLDAALAEPDLTLRISSVLANDDLAELRNLLTEPGCVLGLSDAGAHVSQICDAPQATDYLGNWIRDRRLDTFEAAVQRLTAQPADIFGLADRGRLLPGNWADVVVFDPDTIGPGPIRRVNDFPTGSERLTADAPTGVRHVLVNGAAIRCDGVQNLTVRSGQLVRPLQS